MQAHQHEQPGEPGQRGAPAPTGTAAAYPERVPGTIILMCGPAGAGKTTIARELERDGATRLSYDEEFWRRGYRGKHPVPRDLALQVQTDLDRRLTDAVQQGDVVLDYSFSTRAMRDDYRARADQLGAPTRLIYVTAPLEVLLRRIAAREGRHPNDAQLDATTVESFVSTFEPPTPDEGAEVIRTG